ncbi:MAG: hypothetical protein K940chlam1_00626 [Candidatus Anoxychlamydiales bacterium]|nr:hypothetical protein [Candidatus Anoxychlamydiales bacterium]NGX36079.1 hypothetical protein [Candidatus Anoxychlamydiales bacterium]
MTIPRQKLREIILQLLFSNIFIESESDVLVPFMMRQIKTTKKNILIALVNVKNIQDKIDILDEDIKITSTSYDINRISKVELSILRLALYEMRFDKNIPYKVAITEAIRLTKKFAGKQSVSFVNAILDSIYHKYEDTKK